MALDDSVLSELLDMFRAGDGLDLIAPAQRGRYSQSDRPPACRRLGPCLRYGVWVLGGGFKWWSRQGR